MGQAHETSRRVAAARSVVLIDAHIDHTTGLFMLPEGKRPDVWRTAQVQEDLTTSNPIFNVLSHFCTVRWQPLQIEPPLPCTVAAVTGLRLTPVPLTSKAPPYSPHRHHAHPGDNIGMLIEDLASGKKIFYASGFGAMEKHLEPHLADADCVLLYPEGLIKLNESAGEILKRCDGQASTSAIIADLQTAFPGTDAEIADSTEAFISIARGKGWLRC